MTGRLHTEDEITFDLWVYDNDGIITDAYDSGYTIYAYFKAYKKIYRIDYTYSANGGIDWHDLTPFMYDQGSVSYDNNTGRGSRRVRINVSGPLGWPDGNYIIRAEACDIDGNICVSELPLIKDATPPQNVTNLAAVLNDEKTAITLTWENPAEDFKYVNIYRNSYLYWSNIEDNTFTDTDIQPGSVYTYGIYAYDVYGNRTEKPTTVTVVVDGGGPILKEFIPLNDSITNSSSIGCKATFKDDSPIICILFEYSEDGGINWAPINPDDTEPDKAGDNQYYLDRVFNVDWVTEKKLLVRVTASDEKGRTATEVTSVYVDHVPPLPPRNFMATPDTVGNKIILAWDAMADVQSYTLRREYQNPDDGYYSSSWTVYAPDHSYTDTSVSLEKPYRYRVRARDAAGNYGPYSEWLNTELFNGPEIDFEQGVTVFTNNSAYTLRGTTEPGALVTVNGTSVNVGSAGSFEYSAVLNQSETTFTVTAAREGVSHTKRQKVIYDTALPTGSINYPYDNGTVSGSINITASCYDSSSGGGMSGVGRVMLQVELSENNWVDVVELIQTGSGTSSSFSVAWDSREPVGGAVLRDGGYKFRLMIFDRAGNSNVSAVRTWRLDNTPPMTPTGLYAEDPGGDQSKVDQVILKWPNNPDLDELYTGEPYLVYRSETPGYGYRYLGYAASNTYTDRNVTGGRTYYYVIAAKDKAGNISAFSNEVTATPVADITKPVFSSGTGIEGKVYGAKSPEFYVYVTDNSHKNIRQVIFAYSSDGGNTWTEFAKGVNVIYNPTRYYLRATWNTAELPDGDYQIRFSAIDFSGNRTDEIRNVTIDKRMDAPPVLTAAPGDGCIILTWDPISETVSIIEIMRSTYITGGFSTIHTSYDKTLTTYTDIPGNPDQVFYYKLRITDSIGNSAETNTVRAKAGDDVTPPVFVDLDPADGEQAGGPNLQFTATFTDNKAVTDMYAFYSLDDGDNWIPMTLARKEGPRLSGSRYYTIFTWNTAGLASGIYKIKVIAADAAGNEGSVEAYWDLDFYVSKAQNLRAEPGEGFIVLKWDAIPDTDTSYNTYQVLYGTSFEGTFGKIGANGAFTNNTQYTHTNLSPGDTHFYRIESRDKWGNTALSDVLGVRTLPDEIKPAITSVEPKEDSIIGGLIPFAMYVRFYDNANPLKARLTAEISSDGGYTWAPLPYEITGPSLYNSYDSIYQFRWVWDLGPMPSGIYTIRYTLYDESGNYDIWDVYYQVDRTSPNPPRELTAMYGAGSIQLSWYTPLNYDVSFYRIYRSRVIEGPYYLLDTVSDATEYRDTDVVENITYYYKVSAVDRFGQEGECSNIAAAAAMSDDIPPEVVGILPADYTVFGSFAEIISKGTDNLALASLTLQYSIDNGATWINVDTVATRDWATFHWDTKQSGVHGTVLVRVIAKDSAGNLSDGSVTRTYNVDTQGPAKITGVHAVSVSPNDIVLEWDASPDPDTYFYIVEVQSEPGGEFELAYVGRDLNAKIGNLIPEKEYRLRVAAVDRVNNRGTPSDEIAVTTGADNIAPRITYMTERGRFSASIPLIVDGADNAGITALAVWYSTDNQKTWSELVRISAKGGKEETVEYTVDLSGFPEGTLYLKAVLEDAAGNQSQPRIIGYEVDKTKPSVPSGFTVTPTGGYMDFSWNLNPETDVAAYCLYKSESPDGPYIRLYTLRPDTMSARDREVEHGFRYWYKLTALDEALNESDAAVVEGVSLLPDTTAPQIHCIAPYSGNKVKANPYIQVLASDDYRLASVKIEYQKSGASDWTEIGTVNILSRKKYSEIVGLTWNTKGLTDGTYLVRATATDSGGRTSEPFVVTYDMQITPPPKPQLTAAGGPWQNELSWTGSKDDPEFAYYTIMRSTLPGGPYSLIKTTVQESYIDNYVIPGQFYYYVIRACDKYGNESESDEMRALPLAVDETPPTAVPGDDRTVIVDMEIMFDGTGSVDNDKIVKYEWDFGDGTTSVFSKPVHSYSEPGVYSVSLTVYDPAGNHHTGYMTVAVMEPNKVGNMQVQVLDDETGLPISGASVVIEFPDGTTQKIITDMAGIAHVIAVGGEYTVYAYKKDYMPAMLEVTLVDNQQGSAVVRLAKGDILVGSMSVRRMTLDEIEAAGIDINAPENMFIFEYQAQLKFREINIEIGGNTFRNIPDPVSKIHYLEPINYSTELYDVKIQPILIPSEHPEVPPTIAFLAIPAEARWLKEFFEISLALSNTASPPFNLSGCLATLTLPDGVSLAPTAEPQSLQLDLGVIPGGESKQAKWIVRGDKEGYYTLQAEFTGILEPFGDTLRKEFRTPEPFRVWGGDALELGMEVQNRVDKGYPYNIKIKIKNVSDIPIYNFSHEMKETDKLNYIFAPNQNLKVTIREIPPQTTVELEYRLISGIGADAPDPLKYLGFDPSSSAIIQTGGNTFVQWELASMEVPENEPGTCPVLEQDNFEDEGYAELRWKRIDNVTDEFGNIIEEVLGYRLYRIREDLKMSTEREMVGQYGPDVTSCTVNEPNGPRDYILTTLIKKGDYVREVALHAITGLDWVDKVPNEILIVSPEEIEVGKETEIIITAYKNREPLDDGTADIGELAKNVVLDRHGQAYVKVTPTEEGPITVTVYDKHGNFVSSQIIIAILPGGVGIPQGLSAEAGHHSIILRWNANTEPDLAGYNIYRLIDGKWTKINDTAVSGTEYVVTNLDLGVAYQFCVAAVTTNGLESPKSRPVSYTLKVPDDLTPPTVAASIPSGNAREVPVDSPIAVIFSEDLLPGPAYNDISLTADNVPVSFIISLSQNVLLVDPAEILPYSAVCVLTIPAGAVLDLGDNSLRNTHTLRFTTEGPPDVVPPEILASAPAPNEVDVAVDRQIFIVLSENAVEGPAFGGILLSSGGTAIDAIVSVEDNILTITPAGKLDYLTVYDVLIPAGAVKDVKGNQLEAQYSFSFITRPAPDREPPIIVKTDPPANATEVPLMPTIKIVFSEPLDEELLAAPVLTSDGRLVDIDVQVGTVRPGGDPEDPDGIDYSVLIITPAEPLEAGSLYKVTIPAGAVCDFSGNRMVSSYEFSFTTAKGPDTVAPRVISTDPADNERLVPVTSSIRLYFSESVRQAAEYMQIELLANGEPVSVNVSIRDQVLILTANDPLPYGAVCEVIVPAAAVEDLSANPCPGFSVRFTTEDEPDTVAPALAAVSPADNSKIEVGCRSVILVFSEPVEISDQAKITFTANGSVVSGITVQADGSIINVMLPDGQTLPYSAVCLLKIQAGAVTDKAGNPLENEISITYVTGVDPNALPGGGSGWTAGSRLDEGSDGSKPEKKEKAGDRTDNDNHPDGNIGKLEFSDVPGDYWAAYEIGCLAQAGIMNGFPDGRFDPRGLHTRAQLAAVIAKALNLPVTVEGQEGLPDDVPAGHWAAGYISAVMDSGFMQGDGNGRFRPDAPVTREELMKVMVMLAEGAGMTETDLSALDRFDDRDRIAGWAKPYAARAVQLGITTGVKHNIFNPKSPATREQVAVMIYRVLCLIGKIGRTEP